MTYIIVYSIYTHVVHNIWNIFPGGSDGKESACSTGNPGSIPGSGRSPGGGHGNSLQYSCLENRRDRGAWWAIAPGVTESDMAEVTEHTHTHREVFVYSIYMKCSEQTIHRK